MKTLKQSKNTARKALHLYEIGQKEDARRLAKRVSWRTLFLEACDLQAYPYESNAACNAVETTDKLKGIEG